MSKTFLRITNEDLIIALAYLAHRDAQRAKTTAQAANSGVRQVGHELEEHRQATEPDYPESLAEKAEEVREADEEDLTDVEDLDDEDESE
mgnify:CR=1 FL=1